MAGKRCPGCGNFTFFETPTGRKCTRCDFEMKVPSERLGKGHKCANCGKFTVGPNGKCTNCGATYIAGKV